MDIANGVSVKRQGDEHHNERPSQKVKPSTDSQSMPRKNTLRSAEKHRESTCRFADLVAIASIRHYEKHAPEKIVTIFRGQQTVLATFLIFDESKIDMLEINPEMENDVYHYENPNFPLQVVAFGLGTKYMNKKDIKADTAKRKVRDSHAEILARRALCRFLLTEMENEKSNSFSPFVEKSATGKFRLKPHLKLILYTSSAPCGNSVLKRWAKGRRESYDASYDNTPFKYPSWTHEKIHVQSLEQGQIAPLVKKEDPSGVEAEMSSDRKTEIVMATLATKNSDRRHGPRIAPGTAQPDTGFGCILSCSDKIAYWNLLGVQGKMLMNIMDNPLYISVLVVGRKFSRVHLRRALCCRLQDFNPRRFNDDISKESNCFRLNHPTILCTKTKLDKGVLSQTTSANFAAVECLSWSRNDAAADIIDGNKGVSLTQQNGVPLVAGITIAELLTKVKYDSVQNAYSSEELKKDPSTYVYAKVKHGITKMKMYKFINDLSYTKGQERI